MFPWNTILVGLLGILMIAYLGGGFKYIVYFHHNPWWNDPIWLEHIVQMGWFNHHLHPWKLTCPLKRDYFSREYIFQPLIFRGHVSFQGGSYHKPHRGLPASDSGRFCRFQAGYVPEDTATKAAEPVAPKKPEPVAAPNAETVEAHPRERTPWSSSSICFFFKWWYPATMGFPTKKHHFGVVWE